MNRSELLSEGYVKRSDDEKPLSRETVDRWLSEFPAWEVADPDEEPKLVRKYTFPDFKSALKFTNQVGELAEEVNHHPMITLTWGMVRLEWWTHELGGLHQNDFVMAGRSDAAYKGQTN